MAAPTLQKLLRDTSRAFYLTMRVLPGAIRPQISLAYLLARTSDTIADTELVPVASRLAALEALSARIQGASSEPLDFSTLEPNQTVPAERALLENCEASLRHLDGLAEEDRVRVREVLSIIISGQQLDIQRFAPGNPPKLTALETDDALDDYTWRVAGCVGEFWTRTCRAHLFPRGWMDDEALLQDGIRFGKGLQMVNILRDIPADLQKGRCYIPREALRAAGLDPEDLLSPDNEPRFHPLLRGYLRQTAGHLQAGWNYTNALPRGELRLRLACAWPVLLGARTLRLLGGENVLDGSRRIKVARGELRAMMARSILLLAWPSAWEAQFDSEIGPLK